MGTWRNLGKVNRKGVRKHRMIGSQPPIVLPGWRAKIQRSAPPVGIVKSNAAFFTFSLPFNSHIKHCIFAGNFTCLEVVFKFKRRLGYYLFHTYVPTCLIVIMSWISFWIRPEAVPARVTLGVTSLLTLSTQHANSQKSLPPVSYIKVRSLI